MKHFTLICLFMVIITSCSGGDSQSSNESVKIPTSSINIEEIKTAEVQKIKEDLNSGSYSMTSEELNELKSEGIITDEDYQELIKLTLNMSTSKVVM